MDVAAILSELDDHGFEDTSNGRKVAILNDVAGDVCSREAWPFLEATATISIDAETVTGLPADFRSSLALILPGNGILTPERLDTVTKTFLVGNATTPTGQPYLYYFIGNTMKVWPAPDQAYSAMLMYLKVHPTLAADSVESAILLPPRHHRVLVLGSLAKLYAMEDDTELAALFAAQYEQRIQTMEADLWKKQYDRTDRIVDVWEDPWVW